MKGARALAPLLGRRCAEFAPIMCALRVPHELEQTRRKTTHAKPRGGRWVGNNGKEMPPDFPSFCEVCFGLLGPRLSFTRFPNWVTRMLVLRLHSRDHRDEQRRGVRWINSSGWNAHCGGSLICRQAQIEKDLFPRSLNTQWAVSFQFPFNFTRSVPANYVFRTCWPPFLLGLPPTD